MMPEQEIPQQNIHEQQANEESTEVKVSETKPLPDVAQERIYSKLVEAYKSIKASEQNGSKPPEKVKAALDELDQLSHELTGEGIEKLELALAKEILGQDFLGPDEVKAAFNDQLEIGEVPPLHFTPKELERAKELGQMLVLRVGKFADGRLLTMKGIGEVLGDKTKDNGKVYLNTDWYKNEKFFTDDTEAIETCWALVSKETVENSTNKNYLEQTDLLVDYLKDQVFKDTEIPEEFQAAIDEFTAQRTEIEAIMSSDWRKAAEQLAALKLNQIARRTPAEVAYDLMLHFQNTGERLLLDKYDWTNRRHSDGDLVYVGLFKSDCVSVSWSRPGASPSVLGVSFSRSH